jgi:hypothetical protein
LTLNVTFRALPLLLNQSIFSIIKLKILKRPDVPKESSGAMGDKKDSNSALTHQEVEKKILAEKEQDYHQARKKLFNEGNNKN